MNIALALTAAVLFSLQGIFLKYASKGGAAGNARVAFQYTAVAALIFAPLCIGKPLSAEGIFYGVIFGLVFSATMLVYARAVQTGPVTFSAFAMSASLMVPVGYAVLFEHEAATALRIGSFLVLLLAFYLILVGGGAAAPRPQKSWYVCIFGLFFINGLLSIVNKKAAAHMPAGELSVYFFTAFLVSAAVNLLLCLRGKQTLRPAGRTMPWVIGVGAVTALGNLLVAYLSAKMPSSVLFPIANGASVLFTMLFSALALREYPSRRALAGLALGILGIVALSI